LILVFIPFNIHPYPVNSGGVGKNKIMDFKKLISKIRNTHDFENLNEILGKELGSSLYDLVAVSEKMDKELDILHECLTKLYDYDKNVPIIKHCLNNIEIESL